MKFLVLLALLSTLLSVFSAGAQLSLTFREPTPGQMVNYVTAVLEEAYADLGVELNYQPLPRLRAEQLAESGEIAGELGRLANLEEQLPSLNRVPFRLYEFSIVLVGKRSECGLCTIKAIDNVAHVSGMRAAEKVLEDANFDRPVFQQTKFEQVAKLLNSGRIDAALIADFQLRNLTLENPGDYVIYRLRDEAGYHYLHDNYKHLIEPLYQRLSAMKASGRLAELKKQYQSALPDQLRPIDMPTQFVAASSIQPGRTNADGSGSLWELLSQLLANAVDELETSASIGLAHAICYWSNARTCWLVYRSISSRLISSILSCPSQWTTHYTCSQRMTRSSKNCSAATRIIPFVIRAVTYSAHFCPSTCPIIKPMRHWTACYAGLKSCRWCYRL